MLLNNHIEKWRPAIVSFLIAVSVNLSMSAVSMAQVQVPKMDFNQLEDYLHKENDTTYVINFWATWCAPCVKELPYFEELNRAMAGKPVMVYLVSLDFPQHYESSLLPFIEARKIRSAVIYLDDGKANEWIPKVNKEWSGAIPATLIYKGNNRKFIEGGVTREELFNAVALIN